MPQRLIDVPLESLPHIDEHAIDVVASPERVWDALTESMASVGPLGSSGVIARGLGCLATETTGEPGRIGSTVPGFVVTRAIRPVVLAFMGQHRFSRYALIFYLAETPAGPTRLSAETRAEFPGVRGRAYKTLVITSRGHVLATRSLLRTVRKRAERG